MTTTSQKSLLKKLIESEKDPAVLDLVSNVLQRRTRGVAYQSELVQGVLKGEEDLKAGRYQTLDAFEQEMNSIVDGLGRP